MADLAIVFCQTSAKYFHNSIIDFRTNKAGTNIDLDPQDDGYRCKAGLVLPHAIGVIGSKDKIKFLKADTTSNSIMTNDFTINESQKIIDVDIDSSETGRVFVAY